MTTYFPVIASVCVCVCVRLCVCLPTANKTFCSCLCGRKADSKRASAEFFTVFIAFRFTSQLQPFARVQPRSVYVHVYFIDLLSFTRLHGSLPSLLPLSLKHTPVSASESGEIFRFFVVQCYSLGAGVPFRLND